MTGNPYRARRNVDFTHEVEEVFEVATGDRNRNLFAVFIFFRNPTENSIRKHVAEDNAKAVSSEGEIWPLTNLFALSM